MSGDQTTVALPEPEAVQLVTALRTVAGAGLGRWALIGGLAVHVRLGQVHRATVDVDTVIDTSVPPDYLHALAAQPSVTVPNPTKLVIDRVVVEVIPIEPAAEDEFASIDNQRDRFFVAGVAWALETATPVVISATHEPDLTVTVPVATVGALLAMKLHAIIDRSERSKTKRASDGHDLFQLLLQHGRLIADQLAAAPGVLLTDTVEVAREVLVDAADRTSSWIRQGAAGPVTGDQIATAGRSLLARLERSSA